MGSTSKFSQLDLGELSSGELGLTPAVGGSMAEAASVCLEDQGHEIWLDLTVDGIFEETFELRRLDVTEQTKRSHSDRGKATENGACGIAILAIRALTSLEVLQQAIVGTGFDYWLVSSQSGFPFQGAARLEVSGIRKGDERALRARVQQKLRQTERSAEGSPLLVAVVEFGGARMRIIRRW